MEFIALNLILGNYNSDTICHIEIIKFRNSEIVDRFDTIVNPNENDIDPFWIEELGIDVDNIDKYPQFTDVYQTIASYFTNNIVVYHMPYNFLSLYSTCERYNLPMPKAEYVNSEKIVRRTWDELLYSGYGLRDAAAFLRLPIAMSQAEITGAFVIEAMKHNSMSLCELIALAQRDRIRKSHNDYSISKGEGNPDGFLYGETLLISGVLVRGREEVKAIAMDAGCNFTNDFSPKVTIFVNGTQRNAKALEKGSGKYKKVMEYNAKGGNIQIISEDDFWQLIELSDKFNL